MTRSHSKNNTASSVFSYAEYKKLDYGTKKQRLGVDSMRRFDACSLCLSRARDPVACQQGHLYCKECIYTDLLNQKKEIKRHQAKLEQMAKEEEEEKTRAKERARERVLVDFEKSQLALAGRKREIEKEKEAGTDGAAATNRGVKRKFDFDHDNVDRLAQEAEDAAMKQIEAEQAEARRAKLPDFWLPSLTPNAPVGPLKDVKLQTLCQMGTPAHHLNLKNLIPVIFTLTTVPSTSSVGLATPSSKAHETEDSCICPSCKKGLSNSTMIYIMKSCGHAVCKSCIDELVKPSKQCVVCDKPAKDKDIVELQREGTGFSAGGRAESKRQGVAFQG